MGRSLRSGAGLRRRGGAPLVRYGITAVRGRAGLWIRAPALANLGVGGFWRKPEAATAPAPETWRALKVHRDPRPRLVGGVAPGSKLSGEQPVCGCAASSCGPRPSRCPAEVFRGACKRSRPRPRPPVRRRGLPPWAVRSTVVPWASQFSVDHIRVPHPHLPAPLQFPVAYRGAFVYRMCVGNLVLLFL